MDVPFGGKKLAKTVCMDMCVRGTPVACACTNCLWGKQKGRQREREGEGEKTKKRMSRRARKKLSDEAGALELCNL